MSGLEGKPNNIKKAIIEAAGGSEAAKKALSQAGRKGAQTREENKMKSEEMRRSRYNEIFKEELERLQSTDGDLRPLEELETEAEELATSRVLNEMKKSMEKREEVFSLKKSIRQH